MGKIRMGDLSKEISEEELKEIENAEKRKPVFDEDCPPMTDEQLHEFKSIGEAKEVLLRIRKEAADVPEMSMDEIVKEIAASRAEKKGHKKSTSSN